MLYVYMYCLVTVTVLYKKILTGMPLEYKQDCGTRGRLTAHVLAAHSKSAVSRYIKGTVSSDF